MDQEEESGEQHDAKKVRVRFNGGIADGQEWSFGGKPLLFYSRGEARYYRASDDGEVLVYQYVLRALSSRSS